MTPLLDTTGVAISAFSSRGSFLVASTIDDLGRSARIMQNGVAEASQNAAGKSAR